MVHAPRLKMEINADRVARAGTGRSRTYNIMNTKNDNLNAVNSERFVKSGKPQAASGKRQATSVKHREEQQATSVGCDPNHRAPSNVQRQAASRESRMTDKVLRSAKKPPVLG